MINSLETKASYILALKYKFPFFRTNWWQVKYENMLIPLREMA